MLITNWNLGQMERPIQTEKEGTSICLFFKPLCLTVGLIHGCKPWLREAPQRFSSDTCKIRSRAALLSLKY
jgi:hypothetical protein